MPPRLLLLALVLVLGLGVLASPAGARDLSAPLTAERRADAVRPLPRGVPIPGRPMATAFDRERQRLFVSIDGERDAIEPDDAPVVYDARTGKVTRLRGVDGTVDMLLDAAHDRLFALRREASEIAVLSLATLEVTRRYAAERPCGTPAVAQGWLWFAISCGNGLGGVDLTTGEFHRVPELPTDDGYQHTIRARDLLAYPGDPELLLASSLEGNDYLYRLHVAADATPEFTILERQIVGYSPTGLAFTAGGTSVYSVGPGTLAEQRDPADLSLRASLVDTGGHHTSVAAGPAGRVAVGDGSIRGAAVRLYEEGATRPYREYDSEDLREDGENYVRLIHHGLQYVDDLVYAVTITGSQAQVRVMDARRETGVTVTSSTSRVLAGGRVRLAARLSPTSPRRTIVLRAAGKFLARGVPDESGTVSFVVRPRLATTYVAAVAGTRDHAPGRGSVRVAVRARVANWWSRDRRTFVVRVRPGLPGLCVRVQMEELLLRPEKRWRSVGVDRRCRHVDRSGLLRVVVPRGVGRGAGLRARGTVAASPRLLRGVGTMRYAGGDPRPPTSA